MGLYYQAFTGGAAGRGVAAEDILRRLRNVPVQAVIVGWSEDPALYRELGKLCTAAAQSCGCGFPCSPSIRCGRACATRPVC